MIRYEIFYPSVHLEDIHPDRIYQKELSLAKEFVVNMNSLSKLDPCPISGFERHEVLFEKWGQRYVFCPQTWSLCLGNLPDKKLYINIFLIQIYLGSGQLKNIKKYIKS